MELHVDENIGMLFHDATNALHPVFNVINSHPTSPPIPGSIS